MEAKAINVKSLSPPLKLISAIVMCSDEEGRIELKQEKLAKFCGVSRQMVGKYLHSLTASNILKFKFSGKGMVNPAFLYKGTDKLNACSIYNAFKSDM